MLRFRYTPALLRIPSPTLHGARVRHLPLIDVGLRGPGGTHLRRFRLDCGADDTVLPLALATLLGVDLTNAPMAEAESVSGATVRYPVAQITLRISDGVEYCEWEARVGFLHGPRKMGIAGLAGFLDYFNLHLLGHDHEFTLHPNAAFPGQHGTH